MGPLGSRLGLRLEYRVIDSVRVKVSCQVVWGRQRPVGR